jgi:hypothetical protein
VRRPPRPRARRELDGRPVGGEDDELALAGKLGEVGERALDALGVDVCERVVEEHRRGGSGRAQEPHHLEPLHQVDLTLRAVRERLEVDHLAPLGRLEPHAEIVADERGRVAPGRQARDGPRQRAPQERGDVAVGLVGRGLELGLGEPEHGIGVLEALHELGLDRIGAVAAA